MLALDVKPGTDPMFVMETVARYKAEYAVFVICYSLADAQRLRSRHPLLWLSVGVNSPADLEKLEAKPLLLARLIALTPRGQQPAAFYDRLHKLNIPCSTGTYGPDQLDQQPLNQAADGYRTLIRAGADILTTDRPREAATLFNP
jgi:glycerophosphoryl diester phosphodiesterase